MVAKKVTKRNRLKEKAMLVHLSVPSWQAKKKDRKHARDFCSKHNASSDAADIYLQFLPKRELDIVAAARARYRQVWKDFTLPWMDGGIRILPSKMFMEYRKAIVKAKQEYDKVVDNFVNTYPKLVAESARKQRLGDLFDETMLPTCDMVRSKFESRHDYFPLPDSQDFRADEDEVDIQYVQDQVDESVKSSMDRAVGHLWRQFEEMVTKISETMKQPKKVFRDSLINNLKEFCDKVPMMNIIDDKDLNAVRDQALKTLANLRPIDLRESKSDRRKAQKAAKELLDIIEDYKM